MVPVYTNITIGVQNDLVFYPIGMVRLDENFVEVFKDALCACVFLSNTDACSILEWLDGNGVLDAKMV